VETIGRRGEETHRIKKKSHTSKDKNRKGKGNGNIEGLKGEKED
jgi:hypothetical protein